MITTVGSAHHHSAVTTVSAHRPGPIKVTHVLGIRKAMLLIEEHAEKQRLSEPTALQDKQTMNTENPDAGNQIVKYFNVAGLALLTYEYLITVGAEVHCMWGRKWWNVTRLAFTCTRYMTFVGAGMTVYAALAPRPNSQCLPYGQASNAIHIISIVTAEGLLILRTYAFSHQSKPVLICLIAFGMCCLVASVTMSTFIYLPPVSIPSVEYLTQACQFETSRASSLQYAWLAIFELGLLILTIFKRLQYYRDSTTPLINVLYRDGVYYMVTIFATSLVNMLFTLFTPGAYNEVLDTLQLVLHSILASRILFNLREADEIVHRHQFSTMEGMSLQSMAFQNPGIGAWSQRTLNEP
ncbi:hypothetical protein BJ138DRAFT_887090 [Hygrophoropsis aurantiaca]|uniref:Uncharacterized protein n=1 Tax=Hygrophoropsis aurantiaca TaxID=72124 RepID=A0ACB7ZTX2_9AGAM|nr:hypothetical protein BJ138DRAFT_887090 [Hygrophoropsis aurantiaca]